MVSTTFLPSPPAPHRVPARRAIAVALLIALAPAAASAATIAVTSPDDSNPTASGTCTLRQAITSMNAGTPKGNCVNAGGAFGSNDTITFAASSISGTATPGMIMLADSADASGAVGGTLVVSATHLTIDASAWRGSGAGQYADGVTIERTDGANNKFGVLRDTAPAGGMLVLNSVAIRNGDAYAGAGGGVGMDAADLSMIDSRVSGNHANNGGGICSPTGTLTLTRCTIDNNVAYLGGGVYSHSGAVTMTASTISGNGEWAVSHGGGIHAEGSLVVIDSAISGNRGKRGAGIHTSGTLSLTRSVVAGNDTYYSGGGIHVLAGGTATVTGSTISNNPARYVGAGVYSEGVLTVTNSTITGNNSGRGGGGIFLASTATLHLDHVTVSRNYAGPSGGGIGSAASTGSATINHSIVSGNTQGNGTEIDIGTGWTGTGNLISSPNAGLGPLQDNGGPTPTMLPGANSAAIDAIPIGDCTESADQRGVERPQGVGCDIGAVEVMRDVIFADGFDGGQG